MGDDSCSAMSTVKGSDMTGVGGKGVEKPRMNAFVFPECSPLTNNLILGVMC